MNGGVKLWSLSPIQDNSGPTLKTVRKESQNKTDTFTLKCIRNLI